MNAGLIVKAAQSSLYLSYQREVYKGILIYMSNECNGKGFSVQQICYTKFQQLEVKTRQIQTK